MCGEGREVETFCGAHATPDHTLSLSVFLSLSACASGSRIWPCAVIGHTEPRSLCFRLQRLCGRNAQAVGLINLRDSERRGPKFSAPLLHNDFTPTQIPRCTTLQARLQETSLYDFLCDMFITHYCLCACVRKGGRVRENFLFPHTPQFSTI